METWKDIKGFEGYYQVSDLGNVKSLERTKKHLSKNSHVWRDVKVHDEKAFKQKLSCLERRQSP